MSRDLKQRMNDVVTEKANNLSRLLDEREVVLSTIGDIFAQTPIEQFAAICRRMSGVYVSNLINYLMVERFHIERTGHDAWEGNLDEFEETARKVLGEKS